jgi:hypothetical protein
MPPEAPGRDVQDAEHEAGERIERVGGRTRNPYRGFASASHVVKSQALNGVSCGPTAPPLPFKSKPKSKAHCVRRQIGEWLRGGNEGYRSKGEH